MPGRGARLVALVPADVAQGSEAAVSEVLSGEVQERDEHGVWRTVRLGNVRVQDHRRVGFDLGEARVAINGQDVTGLFRNVTIH